eukprot:COSAG06_NODE_782_length_12363_cov_27.005463_3_plen_80_part_00
MRACGFADLIHAALPYIAESKVAETTKGLKEATLFQMGFKGRDGEQRTNAAAASLPASLVVLAPVSRDNSLIENILRAA